MAALVYLLPIMIRDFVCGFFTMLPDLWLFLWWMETFVQIILCIPCKSNCRHTRNTSKAKCRIQWNLICYHERSKWGELTWLLQKQL